MNLINILMKLINKPISSRSDVIDNLRQAAEDEVFDKDSLPYLEALLKFGDLRAQDILLPRNEIDFLNINDSVEEICNKIAITGHSRFPVINDSINDIVGIFHGKDIVKYIVNKDAFNLSDLLRKPLFVPEIKPIDSLLYEMKIRHNHLAIIVDEFSNVTGMLTLEMIIEQIIGDIADEHDNRDDDSLITELEPNVFRIRGYCPLVQFNLLAKNLWIDEEVESVGGYVVKYLGRIPDTNEQVEINSTKITILDANSRKINNLLIDINGL